tara:strand:+ start:2081 stop:2887 length:807 start_codon:yes stop_codon:yes gene_type:complete
MILSDMQIEQFREQGHFIAEGVLPHDVLNAAADDFERLRSKQDAEIRSTGERRGISHEGRNFIAHLHLQSEASSKICFDSKLIQIAAALMGENVRLYWNQAVTKAAHSGGAFSWHQDTGYHKMDPLEYLTLWIPLEDATVENGTIWVLSGSHKWGLQEHVVDDDLGDKVGYQGEEPGIPVEVKKGSVAVFSSLCFHRSGPNNSDKPRRAYVVQFCPSHAVDDTGLKWGDNIEVVRDGQLVDLPSGDWAERIVDSRENWDSSIIENWRI